MLIKNLETGTHNDFPKLIRLLALTGGLIQITAPLAMLFLPVFATCIGGECYRQSYIQMSGSLIGYALLFGNVLLGLVVVITNLNITPFQKVDKHLKRSVLWVAVAGSVIALILGAWSIGFAFVPGGFILFTAVYFGGRSANPAS
ncbi:MAG: hypothetical protein ABI690_08810 [Chloroflexota bacterium]